MKDYYLTKKATYYLRIVLTAIAAGIVCISAALSVISRLSALLIVFVTVIVWVFLFFFLSDMWVKRLRCTVNDKCVFVKRGFFIRSDFIFPLSDSVFSEKVTTPVSSVLGLASVRLMTPTGFIIIPLLEKSDADEILSLIEAEVKR